MIRAVSAAVLMLLLAMPARGQWQPKSGPLMTRWAKDVAPERAHAEYPRPQMVRSEWLNLNGVWSCAIGPQARGLPDTIDTPILVPFPAESALSGVMRRVGPDECVYYRRTFDVPAGWRSHSPGPRILLHFGAVDWEAHVVVNGQDIGAHRGGYDPFTFDITEALRPDGPQELVVAAWDPTDSGPQPRGKQVLKPEGIWYTPTTGIWQTVWLEPVPADHIQGLQITTAIDHPTISIAADVPGWSAGHSLDVVVLDGDSEVARGSSQTASVNVAVPNAKLWSPDSPHLYALRIQLRTAGKLVDGVESYTGLRKIALGQDEQGVTRLMLNNKPIFMLGPLDQGFWPDGLYTAPTDEALRYDIEMTRKLGFNCARKHVKVEPDRWYYWCDKLGLMVWQDMPSGDRIDPPIDWQRPAASAEQFERELKSVVEAFRNHPSIVMWVPFNEAWGQYDTGRIVDLVRKWDPTRLVNSSSGWHDVGVGDVHDIHVYPGPGSPPPEPNRAAVLGEFGGLGLPLPGHTWQAEKNWGYRSFKTRGELTGAYLKLVQALRPLVAEPGLSAAIYTQTTDVEIEVNGLMTYDRALVKPDAEKIAAANRKLYEPPPVVKVLVPTSERQPQTWRFTTTAPAEGWLRPEFDDSSWPQGPGGFGTKGTPGAVVGTEWKTPEIWLRRTFELGAVPAAEAVRLRLYHDEDCEVYLNGTRVAVAPGYTVHYVLVPCEAPAPASAGGGTALKLGKNSVAVHCRQTAGGQGIDVGLVEIHERATP